MSRLAALALALLAVSCSSSPCARGAACADDSVDSSLTHHDAGARRADARITGDVEATGVVSGDAACVAQSLRAERQKRPVDAVFVIDNSGSMGEEIAAVRANIDRDFAAIVGESGVDLRVVVISRYGTKGTDVCIEPPLAGASCAAGLAATNGPRFFHYSQEIGSNDGLCQVLETLDHGDADGRAPRGWVDWLRPESQKAFVMFSDDETRCAYREGDRELAFRAADPVEDALLFHETLLAKAPLQFGVAPDVRYQFFSIVGLGASGQGSEALLPHQPLNPKTCDTAPAAGLSYQALSVITDALRYPICEGRSFDAVFRALASSVVESSSADCDFELPDAPNGQIIDPATINLVLKGSGGAAPHRVRQVASARACGDASSFFIDAARIELCPGACAVVKRDQAPEVQILYGCTDIAI
jgi:hypothetical protein